MAWRFADLPVRTKFLITIGIPVVGLVLLIGKQVDSSIKRRNVLHYIDVQSRNISLLSNALNELQLESAQATGYLLHLEDNRNRLEVQYAGTDAAMQALNDPQLLLDQEVRPLDVVKGISVLRQRVLQRRISASDGEQAYRRMRSELLADLSKVGKLALDPETKDRLYSHLSLLSAKEALVNIRVQVTQQSILNDATTAGSGILNEQIAQYETSTLLFERDAPSEVMSSYRAEFQGADVNFLRSIIGSVQEKRSMAELNTPTEQWWTLGAKATQRLRAVEEFSIDRIINATSANQRDAELRLLIVLVALLGVVGAVTLMTYVIMRGVRNTVTEVTSAASALAQGDVRAHVPVNSQDEIGAMAMSFNGMIDNIRGLAASADSIGKGNYDTPVPVRGELDVLGHSLARMKDNLKAARLRDLEQNQALQAEKEKLELANARIRVLIKEIHHRVKNNLQVIASLLRLQGSSIEDHDLQQVFDQSQSRVTSMALIHEKLYKGDDLAQLDLALYLKELFAELVDLNSVSGTIRYHTTIEPGLQLDLNTMVPLGLILNELITNSFKHAFKGREGGLIDLTIKRVEEGDIDLLYSDNGVGMDPKKQSKDSPTLGVTLIEGLVEQLSGFFTVETNEEGTRYHIRFKPA
jgi:two-component sensor histidine kinase/HAMP domain-containing protein